MDGLTQVGGRGDGEGSVVSAGGGGQNLADDVVRSALRYRAQAPIVDSLLEEVGLKDGLATQLSDVLRGQSGTTKAKGNGSPESSSSGSATPAE